MCEELRVAGETVGFRPHLYLSNSEWELLGPSSSSLPYRAVNVIITVHDEKVRSGRNPLCSVTKFSPSSYLGVRKSGLNDI